MNHNTLEFSDGMLNWVYSELIDGDLSQEAHLKVQKILKERLRIQDIF
jgi:hypothetical protein